MPCSICYTIGHNKRTCPEKNNNNIIENNIKKKTNNTRENNKKNEEKQIKQLAELMNDPNSKKGKDLRNTYYIIYKKNIKDVEVYGSNAEHYDLKIYHTDRTCNNIEIKSTKNMVNLDVYKTPWDGSVQAVNIFGNTLPKDLLNEYLENLYKVVYCKIDKKKYNMKNIELPSLEQFSDDMLKVKLNSLFMKKLKENLKQKYITNYGEKFRNDHIDLFSELNKKIVNYYNNNTNIQEKLKQNIQEKLNECFKDKDGWLSISGDIKSNIFTYRWWSEISTPKIISIKLCCKENNYNLYLKYNLDNYTESKQTYLRTRNGIHNLSFDFK